MVLSMRATEKKALFIIIKNPSLTTPLSEIHHGVGGNFENGKTPLVSVERGVKINAQVYQEYILKDVVIPWIPQHFKNPHWTLQRDWAPAHFARSIMDFCKTNKIAVWDKTLWPSSSPDLNPTDFAIWSILEQKTCPANQRSLQKAWDET
ncbi:hypothetical protein HUJ05_001733 [Dendroctonus ponderosae]|nr:hypothetical protein HUJ05_001733 [Dendroctonus ponderosae]